ncbi:MAG: family 43 glycosylhydrolase [Verrucomicrobiae bacterium]|nr:family 43 glycosylhydrolase [Verrucomicrobiae bacterium]
MQILKLLVIGAVLCAWSISRAALAPAVIKVGLKEHNRALHIKDGWIRDPYIVLGSDGYYYLTGTTPNPNDPREISDPYNSGLDMPDITGSKAPSIVGAVVRLWRSQDLTEWESMGVIFSMTEGYWAQAQPEAFETVPEPEWHLWAPEVHFINGNWMVVHTSPAPVRRGANLAIFKGKGFNGPIEHPMKEAMLGRHDPSLFQDDDGEVYLLWGNTWIAPLKRDFSGFALEPVRIDPSNRRIGHEGATLRKIGNKYVHLGTAWSTDEGRKGTYNLYYCTSDNILGPYGERKFAGRFLGHGTPFIDKEGRWWCTAFYNANVPPISVTASRQASVGDTANTINQQGVTIVPLDVRVLDDGEIYIRAKDLDFAEPGPEEIQQF